MGKSLISCGAALRNIRTTVVRCAVSCLVAFAASQLLAPFAVAANAAAAPGKLDAYQQAVEKSEMLCAELEKAVHRFENPPALPSTAERVLSLNRNAAVTVGGEFRATYAYSRSKAFQPGLGGDGRDPFIRRGAVSRSEFGDFMLSEASVFLDMRMGDRWRARIDMNLNGYNGLHRVRRWENRGGVYSLMDEEDYVGAAYVELLKASHSGFGFKIGRFELPFGLSYERPDLPIASLMDSPGLTGSYLMHTGDWSNGVPMPHASRLRDPVMAAMVSYEMRDIIRFEAALFQDNEGARHHSWQTAAGESSHRTDSPLPRSYQLGISVLPLEGWELSMIFRNRYSRTRGLHAWSDSPFRDDFRSDAVSGNRDPAWDGSEWSDDGDGLSFGSVRNEQAFSAGLAVEIPNTNLTVRAEYAHGWNQGFNKRIRSDGVNLGLAYRLTPRLTLHGQGEWLYVKDRSWLVAGVAGATRDVRSNRLYRALLGAEYEVSDGVTLEAGWQYEYWKFSSAKGGEDGGRLARSLNASVAYMGTKFIF